jgi:hypothetical protein
MPVFPIGGIMYWSGSSGSIPAGYAVCDGTGGTPDLRDRFVPCAGGAYAVGETGGSDTVVGSHTHDPDTTTIVFGLWTLFDSMPAGLTGRGEPRITSFASHGHPFTQNTDSNGSGVVVKRAVYDPVNYPTFHQLVYQGDDHLHVFDGPGTTVEEFEHNNHDYGGDAGPHLHGYSGSYGSADFNEDSRPRWWALYFIQRVS